MGVCSSALQDRLDGGFVERSGTRGAVVLEFSQPHLRAWSLLLATQTALVAAVEDALAQADLPSLAWYEVFWPFTRPAAPREWGSCQQASSQSAEPG